jgi:hypothetical protein
MFRVFQQALNSEGMLRAKGVDKMKVIDETLFITLFE